MDFVENNDKVLLVQMFGDFNVYYDQIPLITGKTRNSKSVQLFKYFLCNRNKLITQEELIRNLLTPEDGDNQVSILKNIVYRLRKLFIEVGLSKNIIRYEKSSYGFFCNVPCKIDTVDFENIIKEINAADFKTEEEILNLCFDALRLYTGEFLSFMSNEPWVIEHSLRYQELYLSCLKKAFELVIYTGDYMSIVDHLVAAIGLYPYEEELHMMYITTLYELKRPKDALAEYDRIASLLYNDLGVGPSKSMELLHDKITAYTKDTVKNIIDVRENISETQYGEGAYFCNLGVFSNIYQFTVRHMERSGKSVYLMLYTISESDGSPPQTGERLDSIASNFYKTIMSTCRRADVYTRYSPTQFLLMLIGTNQESCDIIAGRVRTGFYKMPKMNRTRLDCKSISAIDLEHIVKEFDKGHDKMWD